MNTMNTVVNIKIPYGRGHKELNIDEARLKAVLENSTGHNKGKGFECCDSAGNNNYSDKGSTDKDIEFQRKKVRDALEHPICSERLSRLAEGKKNILVITSDHTRPVPSRITMPLLLEEARRNNPDADIRILIATGFHRASTRDEIISKFGTETAEKEVIINHDSRDAGSMVYKGILPSGGELWLNALVDWADLIVSEGFIEPHFFAGFSGGRKSVLPGIASEKTIFANHCSSFISDSRARAGILDGNPIHKDMLFAAETVGLRFILNVAIDGQKNITKAFAGHPLEAHKAGCGFVSGSAEVHAVKGDIVITSNGGYPLDQNIYQAVKGMTAAEACVNDGGVIIMCASCVNGHGGEGFFNWFANAASPQEVADRIAAVAQDKTSADQWEAQILARILVKSDVIMVCEASASELVRKMHMKFAAGLKEALSAADSILAAKNSSYAGKLYESCHTGKSEKQKNIVVIPDGVGVIVRSRTE